VGIVMREIQKKSGKNMKAKSEFIVEFKDQQFEEKQIINLFKEEWKKTRKLSEIEKMKIYFKVEENKAYCVVNNEETIVVPNIFNY
jgi:L-fucose mutarotase/ribose pyranase (RbsD/FucU family)